jgi:hypothetical protein
MQCGAGREASANSTACIATTPLKWAYLKGTSTQGHPGVYASLGEFNSSTLPMAQYFAAAVKDFNGTVWHFDRYSNYGDVFAFNGTDFKWAYRGSYTIAEGVYTGTDPHPGPRGHSIAWPRLGGGFFIFGGYYQSNGRKLSVAVLRTSSTRSWPANNGSHKCC